jgi:hypothetical protein
LSIARTFNYSLALNHFAVKLGDIALIHNENEKAKNIYTECLHKFKEESDTRKMASCIFGLSRYYIAEKQFDISARYYGLSEKLYDNVGFKVSTTLQEEFNRIKNELIDSIGSERFDNLYEEGRSMEVNDVMNDHGN